MTNKSFRNSMRGLLLGAFKKAGKQIPKIGANNTQVSRVKVKSKARVNSKPSVTVNETLLRNQQVTTSKKSTAKDSSWKRKKSKKRRKYNPEVDGYKFTAKWQQQVQRLKLEEHRKSRHLVHAPDYDRGKQSAIILQKDKGNIQVNEVFTTNSGAADIPCLLHQDQHWYPTREQRLTKPRVLRLGLDMGTSATKVVVSDPARGDTAWAIPFYNSSKNPYLLPTAIRWLDDKPEINSHSEAIQPFKWRLISNGFDLETFIDAGSYLALVLRHVVAWVNRNHGDYYINKNLVWELRFGLPAKSAENIELVRVYQALLALALKIASQPGEINHGMVEVEARKIFEVPDSVEEIPVDKYFEESGMLLPLEATPEIIANIAAFFRSRKWNSDKPYGLLMDVGASTLDCAFCSFQDKDGKATLSEFTRNVMPLGVFRLHEKRVNWLIKQLDESEEVSTETVEHIFKQLIGINFDQPIPVDIEDYCSNLEITDSRVDSDFNIEIGSAVGTHNLIAGARKFFGGGIPMNNVIPVYTCGGGSRHQMYQSYLRNISESTNTSWSINIESLSIPNYVEAPKISRDQRDRLAVAFGLCADEAWTIHYPDQIEDFIIEKKDRAQAYISSEQM